MSYKITFPNDSGYTVVDNIDGFKASKDYMFEDVVFGWWGDTYIKVEKDSYEKYIDEIQKRK